jgi:predicted nucleic acid-binding protein
VIVVDSSAIVAALNAGDRNHQVVRNWLDGGEWDLVTTPLIVAEVDHVLAVHGGRVVQERFHEDLVAGVYLVDWWPGAIGATVPISEMADIGLPDASLVVLAERVETLDIATFDERFRSIRPTWGGGSFRLLPLDL